MAGYGRLECCSMFIVSDNERKIGQFFYSDEVSFFAFGEEDVRIDYTKKLFRQTLYPIIDQKTNQPFGGYDRRTHTGSWTPLGKLFLGDRTYGCEKLKSEVGDFDERLHISIRVSNYWEAVNYHIRVVRPSDLSLFPRPVSLAPFEGEIELEGNNLLLLFAGIFLVQQVLDFEDCDQS